MKDGGIYDTETSKNAIVRSVEIWPTPLEIATALAEMGSDEQAKFFSHFGFLSQVWLPIQLQAISEAEELDAFGRRAMQMIGEYAETPD